MAKFALFEHHAKKAGLHWDLRFEMPDSKNWASFAFRKNPMEIKQGEKFSCIRTNDHSEKEALFTGIIPDGEYGAGVLKKIDSGECKVETLKKTRAAVDFKGSKLKGLHHFISVSIFGGYKDSKKNMFTFFKGRVEKV
jgi:bifunctional non-homologous end joining protein LigD